MIKFYVNLFIFLFFFSSKAQISDFKNINFKKADSIAKVYQGENLKNLSKLTYNLTNSLETDVEKFRAIHTWICLNIKINHSAFIKNQNKRNKFRNNPLELEKWNKNFVLEIINTLIQKKKTVCTGYSYLLKKMANNAGIKCEIIDGFGRTASIIQDKNFDPNHSWNAVKLNEKWYLCDPTWSSGYMDLDLNRFVFKYIDSYFLATPKIFAKSHYPLLKKWLLFEEGFTLEKFKNAPIIYDEAFENDVFPIFPTTFEIVAKKQEEFVFLLKQEKGKYKPKISLELISGSYSIIKNPTINFNENGEIEVKFTFKNKGKYDVHIRANGKIICTYLVKVKRKK
ncbi:transglutaminase domain-containing protein [Aureivirga marina]|uniref:transglutaminase domain-containing protein n=1 Tax=Aureivirga marina TaxID=1182451 RepID=UPI0018C93CF1|nr:transglutaminase domain-containing protein [Aureivirga marina]